MKRINLFFMNLMAAVAVTEAAMAQAPPAGAAPGAPGTMGAQVSTPPVIALETIKDCAECPEMVALPAGGFMMGSDMPERVAEGAAAMLGREGPRHAVTIKRSFAIGRTEITRGLYAKFVAQTPAVEKGRECGASFPGRAQYDEPEIDPATPTTKNWRNPGFTQTDAEPAVCVSYHDAIAFTAWLSKKTGKKYRLPTEAEWEYAARGWTTTARYWGEDSKSICKHAHVMSFAYVQATSNPRVKDELLCNSERAYTAAAASLTPNPFGLYDVIGNVAEVVEGCAHENYNGAPADGSAWIDSDCKLRNWRGGSYSSQPWLARAASRIQQVPGYRNPDFGLRVVREL